MEEMSNLTYILQLTPTCYYTCAGSSLLQWYSTHLPTVVSVGIVDIEFDLLMIVALYERV